MKSLNDRIWSGDFEVVIQSKKPYCNFLKNISSICGNIFLPQSIEENWFTENNKDINIKISYEWKNQTHIVWTKRRGDFLNIEILFFLNRQLNLFEYKFEISYDEESVYFIHESEKIKLEEKGILFEKPDSKLQFDFLFYNIIMNLENEENDFTYEMISELASTIEEYCNHNSHKKDFKLFRENLKSRLLSKINWAKVAEKGMNIDKLYEFAGSTE